MMSNRVAPIALAAALLAHGLLWMAGDALADDRPLRIDVEPLSLGRLEILSTIERDLEYQLMTGGAIALDKDGLKSVRAVGPVREGRLKISGRPGATVTILCDPGDAYLSGGGGARLAVTMISLVASEQGGKHGYFSCPAGKRSEKRFPLDRDSGQIEFAILATIRIPKGLGPARSDVDFQLRGVALKISYAQQPDA